MQLIFQRPIEVIEKKIITGVATLSVTYFHPYHAQNLTLNLFLSTKDIFQEKYLEGKLLDTMQIWTFIPF